MDVSAQIIATAICVTIGIDIFYYNNSILSCLHVHLSINRIYLFCTYIHVRTRCNNCIGIVFIFKDDITKVVRKLLRQHYYFLISMLQILMRIGINIKETPTIGTFVVGVSDAGTNWVITNL